MKKLIALILVMVMAISLCSVSVSAADSYTNEEIIVELAKAYDRQGAQILYDQYYARRAIYASPEDATAQRTIYLDCSSYVNSCYREAFGVNVMPMEIGEIGASGTSPSTANYQTYLKNNQDAIDVVGYWEPADFTDEQKSEVVKFMSDNLKVGDVLVYRHGKSSGSAGHVYVYIGDKKFMHCGGAGSYKLNETNPALSYDSRIEEIGWGGTIGYVSFADIFENTSSSRYIFKKTSSDTVWSFGIIRPFARGLTPTEKTLKRMKIAGLSMEKTASVCENGAVDTGDVITFTVTLDNTKGFGALSNIEITDVLPEGTEFVSADTGVTVTGKNVYWKGNVGKNSTVKVNYSVRITADKAGTLIKSDSTYVSGIKLGTITYSVSGYSKSQRSLIGQTAKDYAAQEKAFETPIDMIKDLYKSVLNIELFDYTNPGTMLDQIIDYDNRSIYKTTELSKTVAPNLYGGQNIRYGWLYLESENDKTRLPKEEHLSVGDVIVADWSGGSTVYLYAGDKTFVTVKDGKCKADTNGDDIYVEGENIMITLLGYDRYAVLRPSMSSMEAGTYVKSIEVTAMPTKTVYNSMETFDPTGMEVTATLSDGSKRIVTGYVVSPELLVYPDNTVTITWGDVSTTITVQVNQDENITNVRELADMELETAVKVEGYVVGVAHEGKSNDTEMLVKDISDDSIIAVRSIPTKYGTFPNYGYKKGDRIVFEATVKKDTSTSTSYNLKKYLSFSGSNGTIDTTIISRGNKITYKLDNVINIDTWDDMKNTFKKALKPYTYVKMSAGSYAHSYEGTETGLINYRVHNNSQATAAADIKPDGSKPVTLRDDAMTANLGSDWTKLLFAEADKTYPGAYVEREFYAVYIGGNNSYYQIVILDEDWISYGDFAISAVDAENKTVEVNLPEDGTYTVAFADFDGSKLNNIKIVPKSVEMTNRGKNVVDIPEEIEFGAGDKIMLLDIETNKLIPLCTPYVFE